MLLTVPDDVLPGLVAGPRRDRRAVRRGGWSRTRAARTASGVLDPATAGGRAAAGAAPGDDVHRARRRRGPDQGRLLRGDRARPAARRPPRPWSSRWAASRCSSPRRTARCTTPRSPSPPTTWSPWSPRRRPAAARRARTTRTGCSARCSAPPSTTRCGSATRASPVRSRAATTARWPPTWRPSRRRSPARCPPTCALARLTADRALAAGMLSAERRGAPARRARRPPMIVATHPRGARRPATKLPGARGPRAHHGGAARRAPRAAAPGARAGGPGRRGGGLDLRQPAPVRAERGPGQVPAHARRGPGGLRRPRASTSCSRPASARCTRRQQLVRVDPGPTGRDPRGRVPARVLPRRADRGAQAVQPGPPGHRRVRAEGRAAAGAGPQDVRRLRARHRDRGGADGAGRRRARPVEQEQVPVVTRSGRWRRCCTGRCRRARRPPARGPRAVLAAARAVLALADAAPAASPAWTTWRSLTRGATRPFGLMILIFTARRCSPSPRGSAPPG